MFLSLLQTLVAVMQIRYFIINNHLKLNLDYKIPDFLIPIFSLRIIIYTENVTIHNSFQLCVLWPSVMLRRAVRLIKI